MPDANLNTNCIILLRRLHAMNVPFAFVYDGETWNAIGSDVEFNGSDSPEAVLESLAAHLTKKERETK